MQQYVKKIRLQLAVAMSALCIRGSPHCVYEMSRALEVNMFEKQIKMNLLIACSCSVAQGNWIG